MKLDMQTLNKPVDAEVTTASLFWGSGLAIVSFLLMIVVLG